MIKPKLSHDEFLTLSQDFDIIPLYVELPADVDTPVSAFMKIRTGTGDFLFESVVGGEKWARYSFLGTEPQSLIRLQGSEWLLSKAGEKPQKIPVDSERPLSVLEDLLGNERVYFDERLPRFFGGFVGAFGFEMAKRFEPSIGQSKTVKNQPDLLFMQTDTVLIFDNLRQALLVVATINTKNQNKTQKSESYKQALAKIEHLTRVIQNQSLENPYTHKAFTIKKESQNLTQQQYQDIVTKVRHYIEAGDIFQAVLSLRFDLETTGVDPLVIYRAIRSINPSPYMYYLGFDDVAIVGASPEVLMRLEEGHLEVRPIAGTRKRGRSEKEDLALEKELLSDPKEKAEHVMLVDLGRNDVGRVSKIGSVQVDEQEIVERYSHVMHLVSHVSGELAQGKSVFDAIAATFPAGTLSGAPKIRAMQIIDELEPDARGFYGGAVGYISYSGNADLAIVIRTAVIHGATVSLQAGAGIVYNSDPQKEYEECLNKAKAMMSAIKSEAGHA
ncbi:MAG: anthranilate synthase component I [Deltaproteobacteria bacterium]|nr:anthranilate synthase component I [Deltaproteobacteria bacterium]